MTDFSALADACEDFVRDYRSRGDEMDQGLVAAVRSALEATDPWESERATYRKALRETVEYVEQSKAEVADLTRERDEAQQHLDKVRLALRTPDGWATKIHAVYVRQQRDKLSWMLRGMARRLVACRKSQEAIASAYKAILEDAGRTLPPMEAGLIAGRPDHSST